jgi:hypothetical protein
VSHACELNGGLTRSVSTEVADLTKSRSPTVDDETYVLGRKTKRPSRVGTADKDTPIERVTKSEAPTSTNSSKHVPVVELSVRPETSTVGFGTDQEDMEHPAEGVMPHDVTGDRLMRLSTNGEDSEEDQGPREAPPDVDAIDEAEEAMVSPPAANKRSAPASSPIADQQVTGRQKRVRIDSVAAAIESPSTEIKTPAKVAAKEPKSAETLKPKIIGYNVQEAAVKAPTSSTAKKNFNVNDLAPVLLPTDAQFRALLPDANDSSQGTTSTAPEESQSDPIQQFMSPDRVSHNKSVIAAIAAGPSKLAKGVHILVVDGEEVLGVDTDSGSEEGLDPESEKRHDVAMDADVVDDILASFEVCSLVQKWGCMLMSGVACRT